MEIPRGIEEQPRPLYEVKANTHRLFAHKSLQDLNREVREVLSRDWVQLDLAGAQLAICAKVWGVRRVYDFLKNGGRVWDELLPYMGLPKDVVKKALYALIYGCGVATPSKPRPTGPSKLVQVFMEHGLDETKALKVARRFKKHWIVASMLDARQKRTRWIKRRGYLTDCFGHTMKLDVVNDVTPLTLLAAEAQAWELRLLSPAFDLAIAERDAFTIMLYTFDGIYLSVRDRKREALWTRRVKQAVDAMAAKLDIPTYLELEK